MIPASSSSHQHIYKLIEYMKERREYSIMDFTTCLFCQRIKAFLSENSEREIQQSNSKGINRVSILFPTFPTRAFSKPCLVLISIDSDICIQKLSINMGAGSKKHKQTQIQDFADLHGFQTLAVSFQQNNNKIAKTCMCRESFRRDQQKSK